MASLVPFKPPTAEDLASDPSYQFRLKTGQDALERAAAAKGLTRTGGTLKDILRYGQDFASQEYDKAYNRAGDQWQRDWQQYMFANQPRGGGGGGFDIPPPPMAPEGGDPGADPYANVPEAKRRNPKFPGYDPYY